MTINTQPAKDWPKHNGGKDDPKFNSCSPNLEAIAAEMHIQWPAHGDFYGIHDLGCYGERDIRGGDLPSAHSHGAATDQRYADGLHFDHFDLNRALCLNAVIPWLISNSKELKIGEIHDYVGSRIWKAGRTADVDDAYTLWWLHQTPTKTNNMGQKYAGWLHIETTEAGWHDATPISKRPLTFQPTTPIPPTPPENDMHREIWQPQGSNAVFFALCDQDGIPFSVRWSGPGTPKVESVIAFHLAHGAVDRRATKRPAVADLLNAFLDGPLPTGDTTAWTITHFAG